MNIYHDPALQQLKAELTGLEEPQQEEVDDKPALMVPILPGRGSPDSHRFSV